MKDLWLGTWDMSREHLLHDFGMQYHHRCDAWDDEHPSTRGAMIRNAAFVREHVIFLGEQEGFTREEIIKAIQRTSVS